MIYYIVKWLKHLIHMKFDTSTCINTKFKRHLKCSDWNVFNNKMGLSRTKQNTKNTHSTFSGVMFEPNKCRIKMHLRDLRLIAQCYNKSHRRCYICFKISVVTVPLCLFVVFGFDFNSLRSVCINFDAETADLHISFCKTVMD